VEKTQIMLCGSLSEGICPEPSYVAGKFLVTFFFDIHPFRDGNGRVLRLDVNWIL
jgi:hypothetical protein